MTVRSYLALAAPYSGRQMRASAAAVPSRTAADPFAFRVALPPSRAGSAGNPNRSERGFTPQSFSQVLRPSRPSPAPIQSGPIRSRFRAAGRQSEAAKQSFSRAFCAIEGCEKGLAFASFTRPLSPRPRGAGPSGNDQRGRLRGSLPRFAVWPGLGPYRQRTGGPGGGKSALRDIATARSRTRHGGQGIGWPVQRQPVARNGCSGPQSRLSESARAGSVARPGQAGAALRLELEIMMSTPFNPLSYTRRCSGDQSRDEPLASSHRHGRHGPGAVAFKFKFAAIMIGSSESEGDNFRVGFVHRTGNPFENVTGLLLHSTVTVAGQRPAPVSRYERL